SREVVFLGGVAAIEPATQLEERAVEKDVNELVVEGPALEREVGHAARANCGEAASQQHLHQVVADIAHLLIALLGGALVRLRQDLELQPGNLYDADPRPEEAAVTTPGK